MTALLFTAFEPSGDHHAAVVIAELRRRHPDLKIYAWGGPRMAEAGAEIIARTGDDAVMGMPGLAKIREHQRINKEVAAWLGEHPEVGLHVPVDSPAANFPICAVAKRLGRKVVHLVAPQIWAWGGWRIHKLRRLTDEVLCVLPFEESWFRKHNVPAQFIGHPSFHSSITDGRSADGLPTGSPRLALLPGSRPAEIERNYPLLLETYRALREQMPGLEAAVAATTDRVAADIDRVGAGGVKPIVVSGRADDVLAWCDVALVVSGTVTLHVARHNKPMVILYKANPVLYTLLARWLLSTEFFTLPNLIAGREIVTELVPHFGGPGPLIEATSALLNSEQAQQAQREALADIVSRFEGQDAAANAADAIDRVAGLKAATAPTAEG
ncbi:MAG: lipid-A-disaccharide synthase [Planctomycetota bacterium]